jgi:hypothetical protein
VTSDCAVEKKANRWRQSPLLEIRTVNQINGEQDAPVTQTYTDRNRLVGSLTLLLNRVDDTFDRWFKKGSNIRAASGKSDVRTLM